MVVTYMHINSVYRFFCRYSQYFNQCSRYLCSCAFFTEKTKKTKLLFKHSVDYKVLHIYFYYKPLLRFNQSIINLLISAIYYVIKVWCVLTQFLSTSRTYLCRYSFKTNSSRDSSDIMLNEEFMLHHYEPQKARMPQRVC